MRKSLLTVWMVLLCLSILPGQQVKEQTEGLRLDNPDAYHSGHRFVTGMERVGEDGALQPKIQRINCKQFTQHLKNVIKKYPGSTRARDAYFDLAYEYHYLEKYDKAIDVIKKRLALGEFSEDESEMLLLLARIYGTEGSPYFDKELGLKYIDQTLEKSEKEYNDSVNWKAKALKKKLLELN